MSVEAAVAELAFLFSRALSLYNEMDCEESARRRLSKTRPEKQNERK